MSSTNLMLHQQCQITSSPSSPMSSVSTWLLRTYDLYLEPAKNYKLLANLILFAPVQPPFAPLQSSRLSLEISTCASVIFSRSFLRSCVTSIILLMLYPSMKIPSITCSAFRFPLHSAFAASLSIGRSSLSPVLSTSVCFWVFLSLIEQRMYTISVYFLISSTSGPM
jgi:hypothetical protein